MPEFVFSFSFGDFDLKDASRSGRPTEVDDDTIKAMIENNRLITTRKIADKLNISHTCVERHLKQLGYVNKIDIWIPHKLNEILVTKRISSCDSLLKHNEIDSFSKRIFSLKKMINDLLESHNCLKFGKKR